MSIRTYLRTLFNDIFRNNFLIKIISKLVKFYCKLWSNSQNDIKFLTNMPIKKLEERESIFFQSVTGDKIDCK